MISKMKMTRLGKKRRRKEAIMWSQRVEKERMFTARTLSSTLTGIIVML